MSGTEAQLSTTRAQLDLTLFRSLLQTVTIGQGERLQYTPTVPSTNTLAMDLVRSGSEEGVVILTDCQTAGKGRQGRQWIDMAGCNIISSIILYPRCQLQQLVMVASLSVVAAIADTTGIAATIKWPNDVLIGERKVAGILIETRTDRSSRLGAVIGIGVNVNSRFRDLSDNEGTSHTPEGADNILAARAISLHEVSHRHISRELFLAHLLRHLETRYFALQAEVQQEITTETPAARTIHEQWRNQLSTLGRTIQVRQGTTVLCGVAEDVNEHGELLLRCRSGERISITWGDVHILSH